MRRNHFNDAVCEHDMPMQEGCNPCQRRQGEFDKDGREAVRSHGFIPVRSNPSICNDCGKRKQAHLHKQQIF